VATTTRSGQAVCVCRNTTTGRNLQLFIYMYMDTIIYAWLIRFIHLQGLVRGGSEEDGIMERK
jgi:hypothetical protein